MSDTVLLEIVKTVGIIFTAILSTIVAVLTLRFRKDQKETNIKIDGRLTQLLEEKEKSAGLAGHAKGVADQKAEAKAETPPAAPIKLELGKVEVVMKPIDPPPDK